VSEDEDVVDRGIVVVVWRRIDYQEDAPEEKTAC
jgi:hypothetical protein